MKAPFIRIQQRGETFFVCKFKVHELLERLDFEFREPYSVWESPAAAQKHRDYLAQIQRKGIELGASEEGIQRRLQLTRISSIKAYLEDSPDNFLPNSVILSGSIPEDDPFNSHYANYENSEAGIFDFSERIRFFVIDGQHRLAGFSQLRDDVAKQFEIAAVVLFNASKPTAARLFADINGNQKPVSRSLIYDLYGSMSPERYEGLAKYHSICRSFYTERISPLYRQIKMLGIGSGAISQAFFIDYVSSAVSDTPLKDRSPQEIYNQLFYYFSSFQRTFPEDWPVPLQFKSDTSLDAYAEMVLKVRRSQLVKTNGFGAIVRAFPHFYSLSGQTFEGYLAAIGPLKGRIEWVAVNSGTGKALQNALYARIIQLSASAPKVAEKK